MKDSMAETPPATGAILGTTVDDIVGTAWLLGHDLKSPISLIISAMEVLLSIYEDDENMADMMPMIRGALSAANRQHNMVSDMLDLARLETNTYELESEPTNIVAVVQDALLLEDYAITVKQLKLVVNLPDTPLIAKIDTELIRRVVSTLVDNTIKFTVRDDTLEITIKQIDNFIHITFTDNGRPIFPDFETHLVERAPQWDKRLAGSRTSVGMGLPFAYHTARAHGGTFGGKTDPVTKKTTFTLTLPALPLDQQASKPQNG
jgi:two-component system sensor histidine kinase VicK